jgi:hypothetical protein
VFVFPGRWLMGDSPKNPWVCFFGDRHASSKGRHMTAFNGLVDAGDFLPGRRELLLYTCTLCLWSGPMRF